jgi:hypothetical protein
MIAKSDMANPRSPPKVFQVRSRRIPPNYARPNAPEHVCYGASRPYRLAGFPLITKINKPDSLILYAPF